MPRRRPPRVVEAAATAPPATPVVLVLGRPALVLWIERDEHGAPVALCARRFFAASRAVEFAEARARAAGDAAPWIEGNPARAGVAQLPGPRLPARARARG